MPVTAIEGIVENGRIRLRDAVSLVENTRVYVIFADSLLSPTPKAPSPRLAHPQDADDFRKRIVEVPSDAQP